MDDNALSSQSLAALQELLETRQQTLSAQLQQIASATAPVTLDQQSVGRVSRIDAIQQQQMALANKTQMTRQLQRVETALQRVQEGCYGYCLRCGEIISLQRPKVQPEATLCLECQSASENR